MNPRTCQGWQTTFGRWVARVGVSNLAPQLGVTRQCVYHWIAGRTVPPPERARQMIHLSGGSLTFRAIYEPPGQAGPQENAQ